MAPKIAIHKLALGVVTWNNSPTQLSQLLRSIELAVPEATPLAQEFAVWWIDNGAALDLPETRLAIQRLTSQGNVGFGRAMNRLMETAFADPAVDSFLCVNPDGVLHHQALAELLKTRQRFPASLIEARQFPEEHRKAYDPITRDTAWASGACLLIPREIHATIGGFDPNIFLYFEDVDLSWRARAAGFQVKIAPNALFGHAVLNRPANDHVAQASLLSLRYLAWKWKNATHQTRVEDALIQAGYFTAREAMPTFPQLETDFDPPQGIADFENYHQLAPARWND